MSNSAEGNSLLSWARSAAVRKPLVMRGLKSNALDILNPGSVR